MDVPKNQIPDIPPQEIKVDEQVVKTSEVEASVTEDEQTQPPVQEKGSLTPETKMYAALEEERALRREESRKRKELEQKLKEIELSSALSKLDDDDLSEEGRALKQELAAVSLKLENSEKRAEEERVFAKFNQLRDRQDEFDEFRASKNGMALEDVAQLFLLKNNLIETTPVRKGLEKAVGGPKVVDSGGMTGDDVDRLMKNEPKKFIRMVRDGTIDPDNIKY